MVRVAPGMSGHELQASEVGQTRTKFDLVNRLAELYGFRSYLELCSPTTGRYYNDIDRTRLSCHRLMYLCPDSYADGLPINFRSADRDLSACLHEVRRCGLRYDIILVDPYHEYETSLRDIREAYKLLNRGGMLVVHDCLPPRREIALPQFKEGAWCGVTYKAFLDYVFSEPGVDYRTFDIDYGCGVIRKPTVLAGWREGLAKRFGRNPPGRADEPLQREWLGLGDDFQAAYSMFEVHKVRLLRLQSPEDFFATLPIRRAVLLK